MELVIENHTWNGQLEVVNIGWLIVTFVNGRKEDVFCFYLFYFKWGFPFSIVSDVADVPGANMQLPCGKRRWHRVGLFQLSLLIERKIWLSFFLFINLSISLAPECDEWWVDNGVNDWIAMENIWARMIKRNHHVTRYNPNKRSNSAQLLYRLIADRSADRHTVSAWRVGQMELWQPDE